MQSSFSLHGLAIQKHFTLVQDLETLKHNYTNLQSELSKLESKNKTLTQGHEILKQKYTEEKQVSNQLAKELDVLRDSNLKEVQEFTEQLQTLRQNYTEQCELLNKWEHVNKTMTHQIEDLKLIYFEEKRNNEQLTKELNTLKQLFSETVEKNAQVIKEQNETNVEQSQQLQILQRNCTEQSERLRKKEYIATIYQNQLNMLKMINKQIKNMDQCYAFLETYCTLKQKGTSRTDLETIKMERFSGYLDCKNGISADYYHRIQDSFLKHISLILKFRAAQVDLTIQGDYEEMEAQQQTTKYAPAETCHFICELEEKEDENKYFAYAWNLFKKFFT